MRVGIFTAVRLLRLAEPPTRSNRMKPSLSQELTHIRATYSDHREAILCVDKSTHTGQTPTARCGHFHVHTVGNYPNMNERLTPPSKQSFISVVTRVTVTWLRNCDLVAEWPLEKLALDWHS